MSFPVTFNVICLDRAKPSLGRSASDVDYDGKIKQINVPVVFKDYNHYSWLEDDYFTDIFNEVLEWIQNHHSSTIEEIEEIETHSMEIDPELDLPSIFVN